MAAFEQQSEAEGDKIWMVLTWWPQVTWGELSQGVGGGGGGQKSYLKGFKDHLPGEAGQ